MRFIVVSQIPLFLAVLGLLFVAVHSVRDGAGYQATPHLRLGLSLYIVLTHAPIRVGDQKVFWNVFCALLLSASTPGSSGSRRDTSRHHGNLRFPYDPGAVTLYRLYTWRCIWKSDGAVGTATPVLDLAVL